MANQGYQAALGNIGAGIGAIGTGRCMVRRCQYQGYD